MIDQSKEKARRPKPFAIGFESAMLLPLLAYYGVVLFRSPSGDGGYLRGVIGSSGAAPAEGEDWETWRAESERREKGGKAKAERYQKHVFHVSRPMGILALVPGFFLAPQAVGGGLLFVLGSPAARPAALLRFTLCLVKIPSGGVTGFVREGRKFSANGKPMWDRSYLGSFTEEELREYWAERGASSPEPRTALLVANRTESGVL